MPTMHSLFTLLLAAGGVSAFPGVMEALQKRDVAQPGCKVSKLCDTKIPISDAQAHIPSKPNALTKVSSDRTNCGIVGVCDEFNAAEQYVSTSGANAYKKPGKNDIRGPCPGLNAAANHGYLPRSGIPTIATTTTGLYDAYGMARDFGAFLAVFSIITAGDVATLTWSIGGPLPQSLLSGVTGTPQGISYTHNLYEGDTSISRCDAYTNDGDAHSSSMTRFGYAYEAHNAQNLYTLDTFARLYAKNTHRSIMQNPYYFAPLVSTTVVSPAAYNFVINFMSNHSTEYPGGYLDQSTFKSFFAVTGDYPNFYWNKGQERIPDNWYRRPDMNPYGAAGLVADLIPDFLAYPDTFRFGGNTNGVNTYTGIDIADFTGGVYNAQNIFKGDNFGCLFFQFLQEGVPTQLQGGVNDVGAATSLLNQYIPSYFKKLQCPQLGKFDGSVFQPYTGYNYSPTAPAPGGPKNC